MIILTNRPRDLKGLFSETGKKKLSNELLHLSDNFHCVDIKVHYELCGFYASHHTLYWP